MADQDNIGRETNKPTKDLSTSWSQYLRRNSKKEESTKKGSPPGDGDGPSKSLAGPGEQSPKPITAGTASGAAAATPARRKSRPKTQHQQQDAESSSSLKREQSEESEGSKSPKRSKALTTRPQQSVDTAAEFDRGAIQGNRKLWSPDEDPASPRQASYDQSNVATNHKIPLSSAPRRQNRQSQRSQSQQLQHQQQQQQSQHQSQQQHFHQAPDDASTELIKQPETRPISQEQLVAEVKGIYAGLVMVENKCIEVDSAQNTQPADPNVIKLNNEQWQALIALHRTLLHEHHDFFLASQHPSASPALRRLASKYAMPARMWRHGIHSFLELLRHRLPASLEHMLTFIYLAYSMMALLYETVPAFEDTWIECLGDLGRYRMAIEDDNVRDREVWTAVSRGWYSKASDKAPTTGRLYHHLAILARPNALQQLFYYGKALCVAIPFPSANDSIMTLFDPIMAPNSIQNTRLPPVEHAFVVTHGILFSKKMTERLEPTKQEFFGALDLHIGRSTRRFLEPSYYMGISNCYALVGYGKYYSPIHRAFQQARSTDDKARTSAPEVDLPMVGSEIDEMATQELAEASRFVNGTHDIILRRFGDSNILPYVHVILVFMWHATLYPEAMRHLASTFPWKLMSLLLNTLVSSSQESKYEQLRFPHSEEDLPRPLPEDYAMRGLLWVDQYFPSEWFSNDKIEDDEKGLEAASMGEERKTRVLYLGYRIAQENKWLTYNNETRRFGVVPEYDIEMEPIPTVAPAESIDFGELPDASSTT